MNFFLPFRSQICVNYNHSLSGKCRFNSIDLINSGSGLRRWYLNIYEVMKLVGYDKLVIKSTKKPKATTRDQSHRQRMKNNKVMRSQIYKVKMAYSPPPPTLRCFNCSFCGAVSESCDRGHDTSRSFSSIFSL